MITTKKHVKRLIKLFENTFGPEATNDSMELFITKSDKFREALNKTLGNISYNESYEKLQYNILTKYRYFTIEIVNEASKFLNKHIKTID